MSPVKDKEPLAKQCDTSARIQQIFHEVQSQLPSVNFDNDDDDNDDSGNNDNNDGNLDSTIPGNVDDLITSLLNNNTNSFLTIHPKIDSPQQPPSVELQLRASPNLFDNASQDQEPQSKPSILSMDLFNTIDFDKLTLLNSNHNHSQPINVTSPFHRPRPIHQNNLSSQQQTNVKSRDERQILERLAQQAAKYSLSERSYTPVEQRPLKGVDATFSENSYGHFDRHGNIRSMNTSERKTVYIDLRKSTVNVEQEEKCSSEEQSSLTTTHMISQSSESESDDDYNDGMLWFEKRQLAKQQQNMSESKQ